MVPEMAFDLYNLVKALSKTPVTILAHSLGGSVSIFVGLFPLLCSYIPSF